MWESYKEQEEFGKDVLKQFQNHLSKIPLPIPDDALAPAAATGGAAKVPLVTSRSFGSAVGIGNETVIREETSWERNPFTEAQTDFDEDKLLLNDILPPGNGHQIKAWMSPALLNASEERLNKHWRQAVCNNDDNKLLDPTLSNRSSSHAHDSPTHRLE
jgi:hypothetical protein